VQTGAQSTLPPSSISPARATRPDEGSSSRKRSWKRTCTNVRDVWIGSCWCVISSTEADSDTLNLRENSCNDESGANRGLN
jgi:hypothetical protein